MSTSLKELAKKIADLYPKGTWARPGMACTTDGAPNKHKIVWRKIGGGWSLETGIPWGLDQLDAAIAAGPDLTDEITVLGLLALLPRHILIGGPSSLLIEGLPPELWSCYFNRYNAPVTARDRIEYATRTEAIAWAVVKP